MEQDEVVTLSSYRWDGKHSVVLRRAKKKSINKADVYYFAEGEHKGLFVNKPINDKLPPRFDNSLQIPILCDMKEQISGKTWPEVRRLLFNFRKNYTEESCKRAALDFHHDLLHPEIFQRDYCGFIITMMKIIQHRYPEIDQIYCGFEQLLPSDDECLKEVLKHLETVYPQNQTVELISRAVGLDTESVVTSLNTLIAQNLADKVGDGFILRVSSANAEGALPSLILDVLKANHPEGLSVAQISEHVGSSQRTVEFVLGDLTDSKQVEYYSCLYYYGLSSSPSDENLGSLIELLEGCHPDGLSRALISERIGLCDVDLEKLLKFSLDQGYVVEQDGLFFIRRLEDQEIDTVFQSVRKGRGVTTDYIIKDTHLAEIVVLSSLNLLEERGDINHVDEKYYVTNPTDVVYTDQEYEIIKSELLFNYSASYLPKTLAKITNISEPHVAAVLSNMCLSGDVVTKSDGLYSSRPVTDVFRENVVNVLNESPKHGMSLKELALNIDEGVFYTELVVKSLVRDGLVIQQENRFFPSIIAKRIDNIPHELVVRVYDSLASSKVAPKGNSLSQLLQRVDIDQEDLKAILDHLTEARLITQKNGAYNKQPIPDVDCTEVMDVLKKSPQGLNVEKISWFCPQFNQARVRFILRDLVAAKKARNVGDLYLSAQERIEPRCTDSDIGKVLRTLEAVYPAGLSIREIAGKCRLGELVVKKALSNLTHRSFVTTSEDKYFSRCFEDDCNEIVGMLKAEYPDGMDLSEICCQVGIQSQLVKEILKYLIDEHAVEMFGKLYFYISSADDRKMSKVSVMRKTIVSMLADIYPNGMTLSEIQKSSENKFVGHVTVDVLEQLIDEKSVYEENNKYFYNQKFALSVNDYEEVLRVLEAAYPNSLSLYTVCNESKLSEENVILILGTLLDQKQVAEVDKNVYMRSASILEKSLKKGDVQNAKDPTIAIFTADYRVKVAIDVMMTDITTYLKYKLGDESSVYTMGTIGAHRVVATKFSHGYSKASAISTGNATTRLLGTFPRIEHVIVIGLGGGVVDTVDLARHVRVGDVVVSYPSAENSVYYMATNFQFPPTDLEQSCETTVSYTVKRWNCLDPRLHDVVKRVHEETKDLAVFPWEEYISQGQAALCDDMSSHDFHRPAQMTDPLSEQRGLKGLVLPKELEGRPRMCLGTVGAGRYLHKVDNLKEQFVERSRVIAFDDEYDQVTEAIHGNCVDSFMFIRGISDYSDGTGNEMWKPYAALAAAAVMRYFLENLN